MIWMRVIPLDQPVTVGPKTGPPGHSEALRGACLPIVDVPVHIVIGTPVAFAMGMPVAITMGTKKHML